MLVDQLPGPLDVPAFDGGDQVFRLRSLRVFGVVQGFGSFHCLIMSGDTFSAWLFQLPWFACAYSGGFIVCFHEQFALVI